MTKEEYMAMSLPYGLEIFIDGVIECTKLTDISKIPQTPKNIILIKCNQFGSSFCKPICRPLLDLTKEIVQSDYNDGKPFVPLEELFSEYTFTNGSFVFFKYTDGLMSAFYSYRGRKKTISEFLSFSSIQMLLKWHFAIGLKESEFIPVTDTFNPYK